MKLMGIARLTLLLSFLSLTACSDRSKSTTGVITESRALELAKREFVQQGGSKLEDYHMRVQYDAQEKHWVVWFDRKGTNLIPGQTHAVFVSRETGNVTFVQGE